MKALLNRWMCLQIDAAKFIRDLHEMQHGYERMAREERDRLYRLKYPAEVWPLMHASYLWA